MIVRSVIIYFFLILVIRLLGKRQLGEMEPSELVVSMLIADLASETMLNSNTPIFISIVPITIVLILELFLSILTYNSIFFRKVFCGKPVILMEDGKILHKNLKNTRVTPNELLEHLREKGIVDLNTVKYAILETTGQISALLDTQYQPLCASDVAVKTAPLSLPVTLVCNGQLIKDNLKIANKSKAWVMEQIHSRKCEISKVLLFTVDSFDKIYLAITE